MTTIKINYHLFCSAKLFKLFAWFFDQLSRPAQQLAIARRGACFGLLAVGMAFAAAISSTPAAGALLPAGYLTTAGSQITDLTGHRARLACVGYQPGASANIAADVQGMAAAGFNCLRYPWFDATLAANLAVADQI